MFRLVHIVASTAFELALTPIIFARSSVPVPKNLQTFEALKIQTHRFDHSDISKKQSQILLRRNHNPFTQDRLVLALINIKIQWKSRHSSPLLWLLSVKKEKVQRSLRTKKYFHNSHSHYTHKYLCVFMYLQVYISF